MPPTVAAEASRGERPVAAARAGVAGRCGAPAELHPDRGPRRKHDADRMAAKIAVADE